MRIHITHTNVSIHTYLQIDLAKKQAKKELEWVRRMPKAREAKNKARVARYYELEQYSKSGRVAATALKLDQGKANRYICTFVPHTQTLTG